MTRPTQQARSRTVAFLLVPGVHLLDVAGPAHAFGAATDLGRTYTLRYYGDREQIASHQALPLWAELGPPELTRDDLIVVPGWRNADRPVPISAAMLDRLGEHHNRGGTVMSICAGAFALGAAGLLDNRRCTTHHDLCADLAQQHPTATVIRDVLHVEYDRVRTSAGVASGIDATLALLADWHGTAVAAQVARAMVVYARRNGQSAQLSVMLQHRDHVNDLLHRVLDYIDVRFAEPLPLQALAKHAGVAERSLTRLFRTELNTTPLRYQQAVRVEHAAVLIGQGATVEAAAHAVGFADARMLRRLRASARAG